MTPTRKGSFVRKTKDITIGSTIALALLTGSVALQGCGGSNEQQYEEKRETTFSKGVRTYITETSPGEFKITDEVSVAADSSQAIVRYYDGHRDTLNAQSAKALIDREVVNNPQYHAGHSGLGSALLWGGMGYFLANSLNNRRYQQYYGRPDEEQQRSRFYSNSSAFRRSNDVRQEVQSSRSTRVIKTSRPSGGRNGFFGGSRSRSYGG